MDHPAWLSVALILAFLGMVLISHAASQSAAAAALLRFFPNSSMQPLAALHE
jgi:hypothetical protein